MNDELKKIIEENAIALATVDTDGKPYVIAVMYAKVIDEDEILITDNYMKRTKENIQKNKNVALVTWDKEYNGYNIIGEAQYYSEGKYIEKVKSIKENEGMLAKGAIIVTIKEIKKSA